MKRFAISWNLSSASESHPGSEEIEWIETVFCKWLIILNRFTISFFSARLKATKETSCSFFFFNNFGSLAGLPGGFERRWSSDNGSEKKERMDIVGLPITSSISSGGRCLFISFSPSVNSPSIGEYPAIGEYPDWSEDPFNWLDSLQIGSSISLRSKKELSEIFFPFGRKGSETINLLILEHQKDSSNVSFLGPMEFIGIGRSPLKKRFFLSIKFEFLRR